MDSVACSALIADSKVRFGASAGLRSDTQMGRVVSKWSVSLVTTQLRDRLVTTSVRRGLQAAAASRAAREAGAARVRVLGSRPSRPGRGSVRLCSLALTCLLSRKNQTTPKDLGWRVAFFGDRWQPPNLQQVQSQGQGQCDLQIVPSGPTWNPPKGALVRESCSRSLREVPREWLGGYHFGNQTFGFTAWHVFLPTPGSCG